MKKNKTGMLLNSVKSSSQENMSAATYTCPMHAEVNSDKPGKCPKCGMELKEKLIKPGNSETEEKIK